MNAKKAKALRKLMRNLEKMHPDKLATDHSYVENEKKRKVIKVEDLDAEGNVVSKKVAVSQGQMTVLPTTKRGLYLHLKRNLHQVETGNK